MNRDSKIFFHIHTHTTHTHTRARVNFFGDIQILCRFNNSLLLFTSTNTLLNFEFKLIEIKIYLSCY